MSKKRQKIPTDTAPKVSADSRHVGTDWIVVSLAAVGLLITGYLSVLALSGGAPALCSSGSDCDLIQQSHWSRLFGIPVALLGFGTYALIALLAFLPSTRLRRWRRLWTLSLVGMGFSLYLTAIGYFQLEALCPWCLASLLTLIALFVYISVKRPSAAPGGPWLNWSVSQAALLFGVIGIAHAYYGGLFSPRPEPQLVALATHLKDSGAVFYGASWCTACQQQKAKFGGAADALPYTECSPSGRGGPFSMACLNAGIQSFPTWIIRGQRYQEVMSVDDLAKRSGFTWNPPNAEAGAP